jgi:citrate lyase subunit beta/citryl-CoA lyase
MRAGRDDDEEACMIDSARVRRSAHFVPGANEKMLVKSITTNADCLILDLEDAVTPNRKDDARNVVAGWLGSVDFSGKECAVRMNPLDTPWGLKDLEITMQHPPDAYVVPKISTLEELQTISAELSKWENHYGHPDHCVGLILITTETPLSIINLPTLTQCDRVMCLSWGAEDLSAALGAPRNRRPDGS